jgi:hypothetical protein
MSSPDRLPPHLREVLLTEIDPGETLRWCGQPFPSRISRLAIPAALGVFLIVGFLSGLFIALGVQTLMELSDPALAAARHRGGGISASAGVIGLGIAAALAGTSSLAVPFLAKSRALRTVYALTNTRVFTLVRSRNGTVSTHICEPGHPLTISRKEHPDGTGDIALYPGSQSQRPGLRLAATHDPRTIERLIRTTFDPPR